MLIQSCANNFAGKFPALRPPSAPLVFWGGAPLSRGVAKQPVRGQVPPMHSLIRSGAALLLLWALQAGLSCAESTDPLQAARPGSSELHVVAPSVLELLFVATKQPDPARVSTWDIIAPEGNCRLPSGSEFLVSAGDQQIKVSQIGFKRRALYAPFKKRDLRVANYLYLKLASPVPENAPIAVKNPNGKWWPPSVQFTNTTAPLRRNSAIHVNQSGYLPNGPKQAMIGYYLGSLGELDLPQATGAKLENFLFALLDPAGKQVFQGELKPRRDRGFSYACYQKVFEADFSPFKTPGQYRLFVPGLGTSWEFFIDDGLAAGFARTYALGLYHQRCGTANLLPYTRFTHGPCHTAPAEVPTLSAKFESANESLAKETANYKDNPRHTAPQLKSVAASLYPFVNRGPVDVSGGHHDAGDYSKYTINSAAFIHHLMIAADVFPGVSDLDNLGLPESGDRKSDLLQEVKWEADFLAKMQDADGGFYFLVYPRDREYEIDVTPDHGDPQIVFPKTTAATAAATAALAQCAGSPTFKKQFPEAAAAYLEKAKRGWAFLNRAVAKYGKDGAYQKITHYGDEFMHDDELAWAACELFLCTGDAAYEEKLLQWLKPSDPAFRKWGWLRLFDAYGCAVRSYAFGARSGRLKREQLDPILLQQCEDEIIAAGEDQLSRARVSAYGTSFPEETKRARSAGWYFSSDAAFDLAVASQIDYPIKNDPRPKLLEALLTNLNYEQGCNPVNIAYLTGLGSNRQREIVHQYAQNDRRVLPLTGIPLGNIQEGIAWTDRYKKEPGELSFPPDGAESNPYPFYDRWADAFNLSQEFVIIHQARALGYLAWLMAQSPLKNQPWKPQAGKLTGIPVKPARNTAFTTSLGAAGVDLASARLVWEAAGVEPTFGQTFSYTPTLTGPAWIEVEAQLPDGRRIFGVADFTVSDH